MATGSNAPADPEKRPFVWGRYSGLVFGIAAVCLILDQATKIWIVHGADVAANGPINLLPILDLILIWNRGISYGLFQQDSDLGRWLLALFTIAATLALWVWSTRVPSKIPALALALIIGGAIGNGIDRVVYGAVVDFIYFHAGSFSWYVFNLADVWIVAGVAGLLYDSFTNGPNSAAN
jgi:signal peptidase II